MNKLFNKIAALSVGLAMAIGVGVAIGSGDKGVRSVKAAALTYSFTISGNDFNTTSYAANNNEKTSTAKCTTDNTKTINVKWTSNQVMKNGDNMQWQKGKGYIYNSTDLGTIKSVTVNSSAGSFTKYYGTSEHPTSGTTVGNGYFTVAVGGATGTTSSIVVTFDHDEGGGSDPSVSITDVELEKLPVGYVVTSGLTAVASDFDDEVAYTWVATQNSSYVDLDYEDDYCLVASKSSNTNTSDVTVTIQVTATDGETTKTDTTDIIITPVNTVAQARALCSGGATGVYAKGIVSEIVTEYSSQYGNISYNISDDGDTESDQLQAYRGKNAKGANFSSADDVQVGDFVVVYGDLTLYGETYEFAQNNQLEYLERPTIESVELSGSLTKTSYVVGDDWDYSGLSLIGTLSNGNEKNLGTLQDLIDGSEVEIEATPSKPALSTTSLTISGLYGGEALEFEETYTGISVKTMVSVYIDGDMRTEYLSTESSWDFSGLKLIGVNSDDSEEEIGDLDDLLSDPDFDCKFSSETPVAGTFTISEILYEKGEEILEGPDFEVEGITIITDTSVTFTAGTDVGSNTASGSPDTVTKSNITISCTDAAFAASEYRFYKNSVATFSSTEANIIKIEFTCTSDKPASGFASQTGWTVNGYNGLWEGNAPSVEFTASGAQVRATLIKVTLAAVDPVNSLAITGSMTNTTYTQNDPWDPSGFTVNAYYESAPSTPVDVTEYVVWSYSPETTASTSTTSVEVTASFGGKTATSSPQSVTINEPATYSFGLYKSALVEGDYIIYYNGKAVKNTVSSNRLSYEEVTPTSDIISTLNTGIIWHIAPSETSGYWTIYNAAEEKYAAATGSNNQAQLLADGTDSKSMWTVTLSSDVFEFVNKDRADASSDNKYLRNNGTYGFACYASGTGGALSLYKKDYTPAGPKVLDHLSQTGTLVKTSYYDNESFDPTGLTILANYTDSTTYPAEDVTSSVAWDSLVAENTSVTGSYTLGEVTETITISGITVTAAASTSYTKISSVEQLWPGQKLLIAESTDLENVAIASHYNGTGNNLVKADVTQSNGVITTSSNNVVFTLGQSVYDSDDDGVLDAVAWTLFDGTYYLYDAGTSGKNYLKGKTTLDSSCYWNLSISSGIVTVTSVTNTDKPYMRYNSGNSCFSCYASGSMADISFYVEGTNSDGTSAAQAFVTTYMHMSESTTGQCNTYYPIAKIAWGALSANAKAKVISSQASAYERLQAWAAAHGEVINGNLEIVASGRIAFLSNMDITKNNGAALIIVIVSVLSVTAVGGYFLLKKKKTK